MILLSWMIYLVGVSALLGLAAAFTERAAAHAGRPSRFLWAGAILASVILPWIPFRSADAPPPASVAGPVPLGVVEAVEWVSGGRPLLGSTYLSLDRALALGWLALSAGLAVWLLAGALSARRRASAWPSRRLGGHDVLVSDAAGPAVLGFLRGRIVVPGWLLDWEPELRELAVRHEVRHLEARDPALRLVGLLACVAAPWNPALWWQRRRLEFAIECDCDARVVAGTGDAARYGGLLLRVARTSGSRRLGAPALSPAPSTVERRIRRIVEVPRSPHALGPALASLAAAGLVLGAFSCAAPQAPSPGYLKLLAEVPGTPPEFAADGFLVLPGTPPDGRLEEEIRRHHPGLLDEGLPRGEAVWFVVDDHLRVLRTGVGARQGLEERLRAAYPGETSPAALAFEVRREASTDAAGGTSRSNPPTFEVVWMVGEPPPGSVPWWTP